MSQAFPRAEERRRSLVVLSVCTTAVLAAVLAAVSPAQVRGSAAEGGLGAGAPIEVGGPCVTPAQLAEVAAAVRAHELRSGTPVGPRAGAGPDALQQYPFFPMGVVQYGDAFLANFNDLDPTAGAILDWNCTQYTYDGHDASDTLIRSFAEQDVGVPIFAALDGTVVQVQDGQPDRNKVWMPNAQANYVVVDHGGGHVSIYWHMRKGSVAVAANQRVVAGEQLGLTASSGVSNWPHLHFGTYDNQQAVEVFTGSCNPGPGGWVNQIPLDTSTYLYDFGISRIDLNTVPTLPDPQPTTGQLALTDTWMYFWLTAASLPANSTWTARFVRPNGTIAFTSRGSFGNQTAYSFSWWWWSFNVTDMHSITGTWQVLVDFNGKTMISAPIEVVRAINPTFNRPPEPITVALDPPSPAVGDVVFCRVTSDRVLDDLDWDVVRYRYDWTVNGRPARSTVSAGQADAIPRDLLLPGDLVRCAVTPSDGALDGGTESAEATVQGSPWLDLSSAKAGSGGLVPRLEGFGSLIAAQTGLLRLTDGFPSASSALLFSGRNQGISFLGAQFVPFPVDVSLGIVLDAAGAAELPFVWPSNLPSGANAYFQLAIIDPGATFGLSASNALRGRTP